MSRLFTWALLPLLSLSVLSCTRNLDQPVRLQLNPDQLSKTLQSTTENANLMIERIMVNVSGPGIDPVIFWFWNAPRDEDPNSPTDSTSPSPIAPPQEIDLVVPRGSDRIVQILIVAEDSQTKMMTFAYADTLTEINGLTLVELSPKVVVRQAMDGDIAGRYITHFDANQSPQGPTGIVDIFFRPPQSFSSLSTPPPPVLVDRSTIFGGWFRFFALSGGPRLSYRLRGQNLTLFQNLDGVLNPGGFVGLDDDYLKALEGITSRMRVRIDPYFMQRTTGISGVDGTIHAVAPDGQGGFFVGGQFTQILGVSRQNLAHIDSQMQVTGWSPMTNGPVFALAVSGSTVYAGGSFTSIGGQTRNRIAALDISTGNVTTWNPNANNTVSTLAVSGSTIYAGGSFTSIGGQTRNRIAALSTSTGNATTWNPNLEGDIVSALALNGSTLYVGGKFTMIGMETRSNLAALNTSDGTLETWAPLLNAADPVYALTLSSDKIYVGGSFYEIDSQPRTKIAEFDLNTGMVTDWRPTFSPVNIVKAIGYEAGFLYFGQDPEPTYEPRSGFTMVYGFFGALPTNQSLHICYPSSDTSGTALNYLFQQANHYTPYKWYASTCPNAGASGASACRLGGGLAFGEMGCYPPVELSANALPFDPGRLSWGESSALGFEGPFRHRTPPMGAPGPIEIQGSAWPEFVLWTYLPGVFEGPRAIHGVDLFASTDRNFDTYAIKDGQASCQDLPSMGAQKIAQVLGPTSTAGGMENHQQYHLGAQFAEEDYLAVLACPFVNDISGSGVRYLSQGTVSGRWENYNPGP